MVKQYPPNNKIPGDFVIVAKPPNRPANQKLLFSKKNKDSNINNINKLSGAPVERTTKNLGNNKNIDVSKSGFFVKLNFLRK